MALMSRLHLAAIVGFLICSSAGAQVRNGQATGVRSSVRARSALRASAPSTGNSATHFQQGPQASAIQISPNGRVSSVFAPSANDFSANNFSGVPGLGFDFPHLAAVGGLRNGSSSHFGRTGHHGQDTFIPILFGGYPYYYDDLGADLADQPPVQPSQTQPQIIVIQQPIPAQQGADSASEVENNSVPASELQSAEPVRDLGDFILVRRDGRLVFASLFSVVGTQVQYITPEGIRRTLPVSDIDTDATQQMNEARGTSVLIHN